MRRGAGLRMNREDLAVVAVAGQIAHPVGHVNAYRIGHDGVARVLPGTGGIVLNVRIGDRCVGLAGDHIEPGVALHNNQREVVGPRDGPNNALMTYCCVGNRARVISGPCAGRLGRVTGKHGGINHVLLDFPPAVLRGLCIGDRIQVYSCGLGLRLLDHPRITVLNSAPGLLDRWRIGQQAGRLLVPVTHLVPGALVGSGLGKNTAWRGDCGIQLSDRAACDRFRLDRLRFGDLVAIVGVGGGYGLHVQAGQITVGVIVHDDSTVSGHGPGVTPLLTGPAACLRPVHAPGANLAALYGLRVLPPARGFQPIHGASAPARLYRT